MIESLHSPHIARVKALISSRGNKERGEHGQFIAEGLQCAREALAATSGPKIKTLFLTESGQSRIESAGLDTSSVETILVSEPVMAAMSSTITPQGILSVCEIGRSEFSDLKLSGNSKFIYLHEIQDPGNAGTIIRSADAFGIDAVITSPGSVDLYSPKVVRSTAGSLWHTPVFENIELSTVIALGVQAFTLAAEGQKSLKDLKITKDCVAIFGNEARGLATAQGVSSIEQVKISMPGNAESLNLSAAATIVMYHLADIPSS